MSEIFNEYRSFDKSLKLKAERVFETLKPNSMQKNALENLRALREAKVDKALLISATATGKTYLSAFDVKQFDAKKGPIYRT